MKYSPNRTHDRSRFYKYMTAKTASLVLQNLTLRWSSPVEFNDPFDIPREILWGINASDIQKASLKYLLDLMTDPPEKTDGFKPQVRMVLEAIKNADDASKSNIIQEIKEFPREDLIASPSLEELKNLWRNLIPEFRILCLCEDHDTISMWYHYADKYRGVVVEFECIDDLDSAWLVAEPVVYVKSIPEISTASGWATVLFMSQEKAVQTLFKVCAYSKALDWSYEKEWRVTSFKRPDEIGTISDYAFNPRELKSVYLGPLIDRKDQDEILKLINDLLPHVVVYKTQIGMNLSFNFSIVN